MDPFGVTDPEVDNSSATGCARSVRFIMIHLDHRI